MTSHNTSSINHVLQQASDAALGYLDLQFTDVTGLAKTVTIPARQLEAVLRNGLWFDGSALEGLARVAESDMYLRPDPATFTVIPWETDRRVGRLICNVYTPGGDPFPGDPRAALQRAIARAEALGYRYQVSPELEFYLFRLPLDVKAPHIEDEDGYFDASEAEARAARRTIVDSLESIGTAVDAGHHEIGPGQHELDLAPRDALTMADSIMTARLAVKAVAKAHGLFGTFMPKPLEDKAGSGMHVHQQVLDANSANVLDDPDADHGLSTVGREFLAGQLTHARAICAVLAPLVNSYKRLLSGLEAPTYVTWAQLNRSALVRVPRIRRDHSDSVRLELRALDPSCNPYLAFALMLRAGLDGIERNLELPPPAEEDVHAFTGRRHKLAALPASLEEAIAALAESELASDTLGLYLLERFLDAKRLEWNDYARSVSQWERDRYLRSY